jgi:LacI family transcriptional regulator
VRSDPQIALEIKDVLDIRHTDGIFFLGDLKDDKSALESILQDKSEVIALCRSPSTVPLHIVNVDNVAGIRALLDHLKDLGHRRIGFIGGGWPGDIQTRRTAFLTIINELGLPFSPDWLGNESNNSKGGYEAMKRLIELPNRPTAILAADDVMAIGALKAASDHGIRVPDDISVTGFDDIEMAQYFCPSLTTVQQPIKEMSRKAIELMLDLISGHYTGDSKNIIQIAPKLIIRESTGPVPTEKR